MSEQDPAVVALTEAEREALEHLRAAVDPAAEGSWVRALLRAVDRLAAAGVVSDAAAEKEALAKAWDRGHRTPKRYGPDDCQCAAWSENECGCGKYGTNVITPNPYRNNLGGA